MLWSIALPTYFASMSDRPVTPHTTPSAIRARLGDGRLPEHGSDPAALLDEATSILIDNSTFNGHPRFLGYITASATPIGVLADLLAAGINANVGAWQLAPAATEIERLAIRWIADFIGFPTSCAGLFVSGGNMANMVCFLAARTEYAQTRGMGPSRARDESWMERPGSPCTRPPTRTPGFKRRLSCSGSALTRFAGSTSTTSIACAWTAFGSALPRTDVPGTGRSW